MKKRLTRLYNELCDKRVKLSHIVNDDKCMMRIPIQKFNLYINGDSFVLCDCDDDSDLEIVYPINEIIDVAFDEFDDCYTLSCVYGDKFKISVT